MLTIPTHEKIINETNVGIISQNYLSYTDSDHETWRKLCSRHTLSHKKMSKEYVDGFEIFANLEFIPVLHIIGTICNAPCNIPVETNNYPSFVVY